jgi:hypothetical protein
VVPTVTPLISTLAPDGVLVILRVSAGVDDEHRHSPTVRKKSWEQDAIRLTSPEELTQVERRLPFRDIFV